MVHNSRDYWVVRCGSSSDIPKELLKNTIFPKMYPLLKTETYPVSETLRSLELY
jgi:hypothetical protein